MRSPEALEGLKEDLLKTAKGFLRELAGMPVPTAPGQIVALGSVRCAEILLDTARTHCK